MKFKDFEKIISSPRMNRYVRATGGDTRKAMTLYRLNLRLSQEFFTVISCLEIALRNAIDGHYQAIHGANWLRESYPQQAEDWQCTVTKNYWRKWISASGDIHLDFTNFTQVDKHY
jgi:hypothetical protein